MNKSAEKINIDVNENYALESAVDIFESGGIFIYPTDTIYGFGCDPFSESAMSRLNNLKERNDEKQYILLINSVETLLKLSDTPEKTLYVLNKIWPATVSAVLNLNIETKKKLNYSTAAFRIPDNTFCLSLLNRLNSPLISTSVNISSEKPLIDSKSIINSELANKVDAILYTSTENHPIVSAVVDLTGKNPQVLREGKNNFMEMWKKFS